MIQTQAHAVYELGGQSLIAAKELLREVRRELKTVKVQSSGLLGEIDKSWTALYSGLVVRLGREKPELLQHTGLNSPVTRVYKGLESWPRAYREYPEIFLSPEKQPRFFMYAPIDYKGQHFKPQGARKIEGEEEQRVDNLLFAGGWLGNAPIVGLKKAGVTVPADYKSPSAGELRNAFGAVSFCQKAYIAAGRSLELLSDYRAREAEWQWQVNRTARAIRSAVGKHKHEILAGLPEGERFSVNVPYSYSSGGGDKVSFEVWVQRKGLVDQMSAGRRLPVPASQAYTVDVQDGQSIIQPRRDTPEGRRLAALFDAIPLTPGLADYAELAMPGTARIYAPLVLDLAGRVMLLYNIAPDDRKTAFCPPDARLLPVAAFNWLRSDEADRNTGIGPPPAPPQLDMLLKGKAPQLSVGGKPAP